MAGEERRDLAVRDKFFVSFSLPEMFFAFKAFYCFRYCRMLFTRIICNVIALSRILVALSKSKSSAICVPVSSERQSRTLSA